jgi:hypothetical protein
MRGCICGPAAEQRARPHYTVSARARLPSFDCVVYDRNLAAARSALGEAALAAALAEERAPYTAPTAASVSS